MHGRTSAVFETQLSAQGFKKLDGSYEHLRSIRIDALTAEKAETFEVAVLEARKELEVLEATAPASLWLHELNEAEAAVREYTARLIRKSASASATAAAAVAKSKAVTGAVKNKPLKEGVVGLPPKKKART